MFGIKTCKNGHLMDPSWNVCPTCIAPVKGWLVVLNGKTKNTVYTFHEGKNKIGTGMDCEIRIRHSGLSRHHAMLKATENGKYYVTDLNSVNGSFVNNFQVSNREIIDGDIVKFGDLELKFKCL